MISNDTARLGILMLDSRFPRIPGDIGNPVTWPFPVKFAVVHGATPQAVVCEDVEPFVQAFIAAGKDLVAQGCTGIATTCGFLALIRPRLAQELGVPVAASSLEQASMILPTLAPDQRIGILTISARTLSPAHLDVAGVPEGTPVQGVDDTGFARTILDNVPELDVEQARRDMVLHATKLVSENPDVGAVLLECTNMVPYAADIARAVQRPVYSVSTYLQWFHEALAPRKF